MNRMIQLFVLKAQSVEVDKAIYVYSLLLKTLKMSANDRRQVICNELLENLHVSVPYKELCWMTNDNPLFIEIQKYSDLEAANDDSGKQDDSQGNSQSSGSSGSSNHRLFSGRHQSANHRDAFIYTKGLRGSLNDLAEERYLIQNTLKALIACIEDVSTSAEIKKTCLGLFSKFVAHITEEDFAGMQDMAPASEANYGKFITIENKNEWQKMILTLLRLYDPLVEPEFDFLILDIFYAILGLQNYHSSYPLLSKDLHQAILEALIKTLAVIGSYLTKNKDLYDMLDANSSFVGS